MTTAALKKKIKALVDKSTDEKKLAKAYELLTKETKAEAIRRRMQEVVEASERDIKAGRVHDWASVRSEMRALVTGGKRAAAARKPQAKRKG